MPHILMTIMTTCHKRRENNYNRYMTEQGLKAEHLSDMLCYVMLAETRENRSSGFPNRSDTNRPVQSQKQARSLGFKKNRNYCTIRVTKTKALISFAVTVKLICAFVFAWAKMQFSHHAAHVMLLLCQMQMQILMQIKILTLND